MKSNNGGGRADTAATAQDRANETAAETARTNEELLKQLADRTFWGNVLAGVLASIVFFLLTQAWEEMQEVFVQVSGGFTFVTAGILVAFLALVGVNIWQTSRHTRDKKAMGSFAFIILQLVFAAVGVSLVILILTKSVPSVAGG